MSAGDTAVAYARAQIGKPYSTVPNGTTTFDCSLLVQKAWEAAGVSIPRTTFQQIFAGTKVSKDELQPGDLVFPSVGHVQMYVGNGEVIEAPDVGQTVHQVAMWGFLTARRVGEPGAAIIGTGLTAPVSNVFNPATWPVIRELNGIATTLQTASFWRRAGTMGLGLLIIVLAIVIINRRQIESVAVTAAKAGTLA